MALEHKLEDFKAFAYQLKFIKREKYKKYLGEEIGQCGLGDKEPLFKNALRKLGLLFIERVYDNKPCDRYIQDSINQIHLCKIESPSFENSSQIIILSEQLSYRIMLQPSNSWNGLTAEEILGEIIEDAKSHLEYSCPRTKKEMAYFEHVQETVVNASFFMENIELAREIFLNAFDRLVLEYMPTLDVKEEQLLGLYVLN